MWSVSLESKWMWTVFSRVCINPTEAERTDRLTVLQSLMFPGQASGFALKNAWRGFLFWSWVGYLPAVSSLTRAAFVSSALRRWSWERATAPRASWSVLFAPASRRRWLEIRRHRKARSLLLLPPKVWQLLEVVGNSGLSWGGAVIPVSSPPGGGSMFLGFQNQEQSFFNSVAANDEAPGISPGGISNP